MRISYSTYTCTKCTKSIFVRLFRTPLPCRENSQGQGNQRFYKDRGYEAVCSSYHMGSANCAKSQTIHVNNLLESNGFCAFETKCKLFLNIQKVCSIMLKIIELEKLWTHRIFRDTYSSAPSSGYVSCVKAAFPSIPLL